MRPVLPVLAVLGLALTGCGGVAETPERSSEPSASPTSPSLSAGPSQTATSTPTPTPTPEPTTAAPESAPKSPVAPAPEAAPLPDPASLTPGEYCATFAPVSSGEEQLCYGIAQGYIDPVTGAYIEQAPVAPAPAPAPEPAPEPPTSPEDADPNDPSTWQGVDENGNDWAVIGPPPPGV